MITFGDVRSYVNHLTKPYSHLQIKGNMKVGLLPSIHIDAADVEYKPYHVDSVRIHLPLIPFVRYMIWGTPQKDMILTLDGLHIPGAEPARGEVSCNAQENNVFDCSIKTNMGLWRASMKTLLSSKTTQLKGDIHYQNNTLHLVEGTLNNSTLAFQGRVMVVGRNPIVVGTPDPVDVSYSKDVFVLKAPVLSLPHVELKNIYFKAKKRKDTVDIQQLEMDAWEGHISTTGRIEWPRVTLKGQVQNIHLDKVTQLRAYVDSGIASGSWHVTFLGTDVSSSFNGKTSVQLPSGAIKGFDVDHLKRQVKSMENISPDDIPTLKDKFFKPASMKVSGQGTVNWSKGVGTFENTEANCTDLKTNIDGKVQFSGPDARATLTGIRSWPPLGVKVFGTWDSFHYEPEWKSLVSHLAKKIMASSIKPIEEKLTKHLKEAGVSDSIQQEAGKLLGGLFGKK